MKITATIITLDEERNIARAEMYLAEEVFMSGTAAELVPVVEVDDHKVGAGVPGEVTRLLQGALPKKLET